MQNTFARFRKARKAPSGQPRYPRKLLDEILEYVRFTKVLPDIPKGPSNLLDIGAGDGTFLRFMEGYAHHCHGIDSHLPDAYSFGSCRLVPGLFPDDFASDTLFDVITMMAVAEHIPIESMPDVAAACWKYVCSGGRLIITVQHPKCDRLLVRLKTLKLVEGFSMHEHYGFNPDCLVDIFHAWRLLKRERWGFGYNNLFLFEKPT